MAHLAAARGLGDRARAHLRTALFAPPERRGAAGPGRPGAGGVPADRRDAGAPLEDRPAGDEGGDRGGRARGDPRARAISHDARHDRRDGAADGPVRNRRRDDRDLRVADVRRQQPDPARARHFDRALQHRLRADRRHPGADLPPPLPSPGGRLRGAAGEHQRALLRHVDAPHPCGAAQRTHAGGHGASGRLPRFQRAARGRMPGEIPGACEGSFVQAQVPEGPR